MTDENNIVRERQRLVRREMDRRGIAIKAVQLDGGWENSSTVLSYFPADRDREPATMSLASFYRLAEREALPLDLLNLLLPEGLALVRKPEGVDFDEVAEWAEAFSARKLAAHRKDSECEEQLGPTECADLTGIVVAFPVRAA